MNATPNPPQEQNGQPAKPTARRKSTVTTNKGGKRGRRTQDRARNFPRVTLESALAIAAALKDKNGGNDWPPSEVAKAIQLSVKTPKFFYLAAGSRDYGLTEGGRDSDKIALSALGRAVVYPQSAEVERNAKLQAFLKIAPFRKVLEHYHGANLPEREYLSNTLITAFDIHSEYHDEFIPLFSENCKYLGIGDDFQPDSGPASLADGSPVKRAEIITHAAPEKGRGPLCFVIMPFTERQPEHVKGFFREVLESLIVPACGELGFVVRSANREGSDVIQSTIVNDLLEADLVVADLTEHNPNVLFELGMRMAEDKPVALIRAKGTGKIFDVDNMLRVYGYDPSLWPSTLKLDLPNIRNHVKATWENRERSVSYMQLLRQSKAHPQTEQSNAGLPGTMWQVAA